MTRAHPILHPLRRLGLHCGLLLDALLALLGGRRRFFFLGLLGLWLLGFRLFGGLRLVARLLWLLAGGSFLLRGLFYPLRAPLLFRLGLDDDLPVLDPEAVQLVEEPGMLRLFCGLLGQVRVPEPG